MVWVLVIVELGGRVGEGGVGLTGLPSSTPIGSGVGLVLVLEGVDLGKRVGVGGVGLVGLSMGGGDGGGGCEGG